MPNLIKVVTLDSGIKNQRFESMYGYGVEDIIKRYKIEKNGFRFTFVQEIKSAKTIFDYDKYNPGSGMAYSLLLFNPNLGEKNRRRTKKLLRTGQGKCSCYNVL